jgi:tetratricopeptide (TPR) repeat protein
MKHILLTFFACLSISVIGQTVTWEIWSKAAETDKYLIPKFGHLAKTDEQKRIDEQLIKEVLEKDSSRSHAAEHLIAQGLQSVYQDVYFAMAKFNLAYLIDSSNTDIYLGYGAVYIALGKYDKAIEQYNEGLKLNPKNTKILTDYGTCYMVQCFDSTLTDKKLKSQLVDSALHYMNKSYYLNPRDAFLAFKMSYLSLNVGDCTNAWRFYNQTVLVDKQAVMPGYVEELRAKCPLKSEQ